MQTGRQRGLGSLAAAAGCCPPPIEPETRAGAGTGPAATGADVYRDSSTGTVKSGSQQPDDANLVSSTQNPNGSKENVTYVRGFDAAFSGVFIWTASRYKVREYLEDGSAPVGH